MMDIARWEMLLGGLLLAIVLLQWVTGLAATRRLARRLDAIEEAQQRAASTDVPTSMLVTGMARIEARLKQLESMRQTQPATPAQSGDRAYQLAQRMARDGADAAHIVESCGITLHEAELLTRLHAPASH